MPACGTSLELWHAAHAPGHCASCSFADGTGTAHACTAAAGPPALPMLVRAFAWQWCTASGASWPVWLSRHANKAARPHGHNNIIRGRRCHTKRQHFCQWASAGDQRIVVQLYYLKVPEWSVVFIALPQFFFQLSRNNNFFIRVLAISRTLCTLVSSEIVGIRIRTFSNIAIALHLRTFVLMTNWVLSLVSCHRRGKLHSMAL